MSQHVPQDSSLLCQAVIIDPQINIANLVLLASIHDGMIDGYGNWINDDNVLEERHFKDVPFTLIERPWPNGITYSCIYPDAPAQRFENIEDTEELIIHVQPGAFVAAIGEGVII